MRRDGRARGRIDEVVLGMPGMAPHPAPVDAVALRECIEFLPQLAIGDRLHIIPNHICVAVNLHECVYGVRKGQVEETWQVKGRGKLQ